MRCDSVVNCAVCSLLGLRRAGVNFADAWCLVGGRVRCGRRDEGGGPCLGGFGDG